MGRGRADIHIGNGVFERFGFDELESRKFIDKSRTKQPERLMWCIIYTSMASDVNAFVGREGRLYTYTGVGLSALLVSTCRAMRRPFYRGTSDRTGSTLFMCM